MGISGYIDHPRVRYDRYLDSFARGQEKYGRLPMSSRGQPRTMKVLGEEGYGDE